MRLSEPRVTPLTMSEMSEEQREIVKRAASGNDQPPNIFLTLGHYPKLLKRWTVFSSHVLNKSSLPGRERELAILRIGHLCRSGYEWFQHARIGKDVGLTDEEIERIKEGPKASGWSATDRAVLQATDELHSDSFISDATWNELKKTYRDDQLMDLIFAVGNYTLVSMALNTLGVQLESE
jgi:4-carboxymuconolactone decarboxylase